MHDRSDEILDLFLMTQSQMMEYASMKGWWRKIISLKYLGLLNRFASVRHDLPFSSGFILGIRNSEVTEGH